MLSEEEKKLLIIFKAQVEKEETEYFSVNAYTQLLYDSHKTVLNLITKLQKENEEKDKQIDLMAEFMIGGLEDIAFNAICKKSHCTYELKDNRPTNFRKCKLCIKQHFEKLAKEKGE